MYKTYGELLKHRLKVKKKANATRYSNAKKNKLCLHCKRRPAGLPGNGTKYGARCEHCYSTTRLKREASRTVTQKLQPVTLNRKEVV